LKREQSGRTTQVAVRFNHLKRTQYVMLALTELYLLH